MEPPSETGGVQAREMLSSAEKDTWRPSGGPGGSEIGGLVGLGRVRGEKGKRERVR